LTADLSRDCTDLVAASLTNNPDANSGLAEVTDVDASIPVNQGLNQGVSNVSLQAAIVGGRLAALRSGSSGVSGLNFRSLENIAGTRSGALPDGYGGAASADGTSFGQFGIFASGGYGNGDKNETSNVAGFDFDAYNFTAGIDYRLNDNLIIGAALSYATADANIDNNGGSVDADTISGSIYGTFYQSDNFFVDGALNFGSSNYDQHRKLTYQLNDLPVAVTGRPAANVNQKFYADYDGNKYAMTINGGYEIHQGALTITPSGRFQYIKVNVDEFREDKVSNPNADGSGMGVEIDSQEFKSLNTSLGAQVNYAISQSWGVLLPYGGLNWVHEFEDNDEDVTGRFLGDSSRTTFRLPTDNSDSDYFNANIGLLGLFTQGASAFVDYQALLGYEDLNYYQINAGVRFEF
jgi:uncharacterized protein with beta-barrel porin domain